jgi:hypothetical protein
MTSLNRVTVVGYINEIRKIAEISNKSYLFIEDMEKQLRDEEVKEIID